MLKRVKSSSLTLIEYHPDMSRKQILRGLFIVSGNHVFLDRLLKGITGPWVWSAKEDELLMQGNQVKGEKWDGIRRLFLGYDN